MTENEVSKLRPGLYLVFWEGGGTSHAAIGTDAYRNGRHWIAATDDLGPGQGRPPREERGWRRVREVQPLTGPDAKEPLENQERAFARQRLERITALAVGEEPRAKDKIAALADELSRALSMKACLAAEPIGGMTNRGVIVLCGTCHKGTGECDCPRVPPFTEGQEVALADGRRVVMANRNGEWVAVEIAWSYALVGVVLEAVLTNEGRPCRTCEENGPCD